MEALIILILIYLVMLWQSNQRRIEGFTTSQPSSYKRFSAFQTPYGATDGAADGTPWSFYQSPWIMYGEPWIVPRFAYYQNQVPTYYSKPNRDYYGNSLDLSFRR